MGQQCCQAITHDDYLAVKTLSIKQKDFKPVPASDLVDPILIEKILDLQQQTVFHNQEENRYFIGKWKNGDADGSGTLFIPDHLIYQGTFENATPQGEGEMTFLNKNQQYRGYFQAGKANGKGFFKSNPKKFTFEGEWIDSKPSKGILMFEENANISKIEIHDLLTGKAHILYKDGRQYIGQINRDLFVPEGHGQLNFLDGSSYKGSWKNGQMHGEGIYAWKDGSRYEGSYLNGKKQGYGIFHYTSGKQYVGNWVNGKQEGIGKIVIKEGEIQKDGIWKNGTFDKKVQEEQPKESSAEGQSNGHKQVQQTILQPIS